MNRRFQFSLKWLLAAALVMPPAGYWVVQSWHASRAAHDYHAASAFHEMRTGTFEDAYGASRRLREAQLSVPFANRRAVLTAYMNRVAHLERSVYGLVHFATWGSEDAYNEAVAQLKSLSAERIALERELGIKAIEETYE